MTKDHKNAYMLTQIIITRPYHDAEKLRKLILKNTCLIPYICSCIDISPLQFKPINSYYDGIIFTSKNAVKYFSDSLNIASIYAIGSSTAECIIEKYCRDVTFPDYRGMGNLIEIFKKIKVKDKKYLIVQGKNGKPELKEALERMSAVVDTMDCYERVVPKKLESNFNSLLLNKISKAGKSIIVFTSFEGLRNLWYTLSDHKYLLSSAITVTSAQMHDWAHEKGFSEIIFLDDISNEGIIGNIQKYMNF